MNPGTEIDGANGDRLPGMQSPVVERGLMVAHREDRGKVGKPSNGATDVHFLEREFA